MRSGVSKCKLYKSIQAYFSNKHPEICATLSRMTLFMLMTDLKWIVIAYLGHKKWAIAAQLSNLGICYMKIILIKYIIT